MLEHSLSSGNVAVCVKEQDRKVLMQDDLCRSICGERTGQVCNDGCMQLLAADHTLLAFRDRSGGATIAVNGRCGKDGDDVPLESLTHHLFLHFTERQVAGQSKLALDGRDALRTVLLAKLDGVPKHFTVVVLKKNGCVYDFLRIGHDGSTVQDFDGFVRGFSTLS